MLKRLIKNIRQKPKYVRDNIALMIAFVITSGIFSVWLYNAPARYAEIDNRQGQVSVLKEDKVGFAGVFSNIGKQFASIKEAVITNVASTSVGTSTVGSDLLQSITVPEEPNFGFVQPDKPTAREVRIVTVKSSTSATSSASEER